MLWEEHIFYFTIKSFRNLLRAYNFKEVYSYLNSHNISKKINNINNLKKFLLKDLSLKDNRSQKLKKRINTMGQSILKNIELEIKKFIVSHK